MKPAELIFVRKGMEYTDPDIREITEEDEMLIKELCEDSRENDTEMGKIFANVHYNRDDYESLFGVFHDGKLVGLVEAVQYEDTDFIDICSMFVHKNYRNRGFESRLVKAVLDLYPEKNYQYRTSEQDTHDSAALARSLDFKFVTELTNNDDIFQKIKEVMK